jgi:hypothetical protein
MRLVQKHGQFSAKLLASRGTQESVFPRASGDRFRTARPTSGHRIERFTNSQFATFIRLRSTSAKSFPATLASTLQITEKPATLSLAFATLTSRVKHATLTKNTRGGGTPFSERVSLFLI